MPKSEIEIGVLAGPRDGPYATALALTLISRRVRVDVIGRDEVDSPELHVTPNLRFLNLREGQTHEADFAKKFSGLAAYYARLIQYTARVFCRSRVIRGNLPNPSRCTSQAISTRILRSDGRRSGTALTENLVARRRRTDSRRARWN